MKDTDLALPDRSSVIRVQLPTSCPEGDGAVCPAEPHRKLRGEFGRGPCRETNCSGKCIPTAS